VADMNKKIMIILVLLFSIVSILLIAVWGTLPENANQIQLESLIIVDYDEENPDGDKFIDVSDRINEQNNIYVISYSTNPSNAYVSLIATASSDQVVLQTDSYSNQVRVIYDLNAIQDKPMITIRITDQNTQHYDEVTLWFKTPGVIIVPDL
jgi:hypothetical protein